MKIDTLGRRGVDFPDQFIELLLVMVIIRANSSNVVSSRALGTFVNEKLAPLVGRCCPGSRHRCGKKHGKKCVDFRYPLSAQP